MCYRICAACSGGRDDYMFTRLWTGIPRGDVVYTRVCSQLAPDAT